jgi:hypothetical protein
MMVVDTWWYTQHARPSKKYHGAVRVSGVVNYKCTSTCTSNTQYYYMLQVHNFFHPS